MSFPPNPNTTMGRPNHGQPPREVSKLEASKDSPNLSEDEGPLDLSMPRLPNGNPKPMHSGNAVVGSYDVDSSDQPIDYSKKYVESNSSNSAMKSNYVPRNSLVLCKPRNDIRVDPYGDYAETDLDQPTDYSLRYAEDDTDDEETQNEEYFAGNEQEDTVKTYCTEGTPFDTPLNFSTSTSMSDLRLDEGKDLEGGRKVGRKIIQDERLDNRNATVTIKPDILTFAEEEGKESKELKEVEESETEIRTKETKNLSDELVLNSSSVSIDKPINYYDEGTPGRMSRSSSLSSLGCEIIREIGEASLEGIEESAGQKKVVHSKVIHPGLPVSPIPMASSGRAESEEDLVDPQVEQALDNSVESQESVVSGADEETKGDERVGDKEGKNVTFGGEDHYAEQTPLMFSRSSSLGSLSGFEQHSIHDDRSSIVSEYSRRTSRAVSPSELPDSPSQTVPPSPRHNQRAHSNDISPRALPMRNYSYIKSPRPKSSVFEDNLASFKEESTPIEFSAATSLSSLTIDDDEPPRIIVNANEADYHEKARTLGRSILNNAALIIDNNGNQLENETDESEGSHYRNSKNSFSNDDDFRDRKNFRQLEESFDNVDDFIEQKTFRPLEQSFENEDDFRDRKNFRKLEQSFESDDDFRDRKNFRKLEQSFENEDDFRDRKNFRKLEQSFENDEDFRDQKNFRQLEQSFENEDDFRDQKNFRQLEQSFENDEDFREQKNFRQLEQSFENEEDFRDEKNFRLLDESEEKRGELSEGEEDDEDILAACISMGMGNNVYRQSLKNSTETEEKMINPSSSMSASTLVRYQTSATLDRLSSDASGSAKSSNSTEEILSIIPERQVRLNIESVVPPDNLHVYCTEDTPADISPVGSQSNLSGLSALSMPSLFGDFGKDEMNRSYADDEDWISGDDEKILEECIRSGIPKPPQNNNFMTGPSTVPVLAPDYNSPSHVTKNSPVTKLEGIAGVPGGSLTPRLPTTSSPTQVEANDLPVHHCMAFNNWRMPPKSPVHEGDEDVTTSFGEFSENVDHDSVDAYDDCSHHSDDDAILAQCIESALPKGIISSNPFVSPVMPTKAPKPPPRTSSIDDGSAYKSSRVMTQVFRGSVTRITITHEMEKIYADTSSLSEEEEEMILAQCIRSGMPKASSVPPR